MFLSMIVVYFFIGCNLYGSNEANLYSVALLSKGTLSDTVISSNTAYTPSTACKM